jgi:hypothetical protein
MHNTTSTPLIEHLQSCGIDTSLLVGYLRRSIGQDRKPRNIREAIQFKLQAIQVERLTLLIS